MNSFSFFEQKEPMKFTVSEATQKRLALITENFAEQVEREIGREKMVYCLDRICQAALERNTDTQFIDQLADTIKDAFFGEDNVPKEFVYMIKRMKDIAHDRQRKQEEEAHRRQLELQGASATILQPVQNMYTPYSITNDGQANIGGGNIAIGG